MLQEMIDEWFIAWCAYHKLDSVEIRDGDTGSGRIRWQRFTEPGDTRDIRQSLAEFDDKLTSWLGSRRRITWRVRPRWTAHFTIECELAADWTDERARA